MEFGKILKTETGVSRSFLLFMSARFTGIYLRYKAAVKVVLSVTGPADAGGIELSLRSGFGLSFFGPAGFKAGLTQFLHF